MYFKNFVGYHLILSFCCSIVLVLAATGSSCVWLFCLFVTFPPSFLFWTLSYFQPPQDAQWSSWIFLAPSLESATSPKSSIFRVIGEWHLETQIWVQDMLVATEVSLCLDPPGGLYMFVYLCNRLTRLYVGLSVNVLRKRIRTDTSISNPAS